MNSQQFAGFRRQINGFNRDDVNQFIRELDTRTANEIASLKEELKSANEQFSAAKSAELKLRSENEGLTAIINSKDAKINELSDSLESALTQANDFQQSLNEAKVKCAEQTDIIETLKKQLQSLGINPSEVNENGTISSESISADIDDIANHNSPAYKLKMYDKISNQLGDIMINANRNAREILSTASQEADKLKADVVDYCESQRKQCDEEIRNIRDEVSEETSNVRKKLSATANDLLAKVNSNIHTNMDNCTHEIGSCLNELQYEVKSMLSKIASRTDDMNERISYFTTAVSEEIEKSLSSFDEKFDFTKTENTQDQSISSDNDKS